ncbi:hypothetical protein [Cellulosimicrobium sp. 22601]|uniref:hypothetical protein n=1 Tax=unclassified Cellulosimicrobium TaxID=2624466 RepID=UPI003F838493
MGRPIKIELDAETTAAERGLDRTADALDDVSDALDDVDKATRDADRGLDDVADAARDAERGLKDVEDAASDTARTLDRDLTKALESVEDQAERTGKRVGDDSERGFRRAGDSVAEFKDEARQNFGEVAASFSGEIDSAADLVQGTLGGLAGSIAGPVGAIAGLGAGIFGAWYASAQENAEKTEERVQEMFDDLLESGAEYLSRDFIAQRLQDIYKQTEDMAVSWERLEEIVKWTGATEQEVALAFAGDAQARASLLDTLRQKHQEVADDAKRLDLEHSQTFKDAEFRYESMIKDLERQDGELLKAQDMVNSYRAAIMALPDEQVTDIRTKMNAGDVEGVRSALDGLSEDQRVEIVPFLAVEAAQAAVDRAMAAIRPPSVVITPRLGREAV